MVDLTDKLAKMQSPRIADLGDLAEVEREGLRAALDLHADRLVHAISYEEPVTTGLAAVILKIIEQNPYPIVISATILQIKNLALPAASWRQLQRALLARASQRDTPLSADMASECLGGAFLLASAGRLSQLAVLSHLEEIQAGEDPRYLRRAARIAGLAWAWRRTPEMQTVLERLANDEEAGDQALFELGLLYLDNALEAADKETLIEKLTLSAETFQSALRHNPDLIQAEAFGATLLAVALFCTEAPADDVELQLATARRAFDDRMTLLDQVSLRSWLRPRYELELAWRQLVVSLSGLAPALNERSWLRAVPILQRIASARRAMVGGASIEGEAIRRALTARFVDSFLAREGLRAHLEAWAADPTTSDVDRAEALALLTFIEQTGSSLGKEFGPASLQTIAGPKVYEIGRSEDAQHLKRKIAMLLRCFELTITTKIEEVFLAIEEKIQSHPDYVGSVQQDLTFLVFYLLVFLSHCLDVGKRMADSSFSFLFERSGDKPLEVELQSALFTWLRIQLLGFPQHTVISEAYDVAAGRADIAVIRPNWRIPIEVKRELQDASRTGIRKYLGQSASYALTGPRFGFLVVLDLCTQKQWTLTLEDNCWVEDVTSQEDTISRKILVFRVPGMRSIPSATITPSK